MRWYRRYSDFTTRTDFLKVKAVTGLAKPIICAVWDCAEGYASRHRDRGSIAGLDRETIALEMEVSEEQAAAVIKAMFAKGILAKGKDGELRFARWDEEQMADPTAAERMRAYRERLKARAVNGHAPGNGGAETSGGEAEPEREAPPEPVTVTLHKSRGDKNREEDPPLAPPLPGGAEPREGKVPDKPRRPRGGERGTPIPPGYEPDLAKAREIGLSASDAEAEAGKFVDHWRASAGSKALKKDWGAAWSLWCRRALEDRGKRAGGGGNGGGGFGRPVPEPRRARTDVIPDNWDELIFGEGGKPSSAAAH